MKNKMSEKSQVHCYTRWSCHFWSIFATNWRCL